jgi:hypothetical protein
MSEEIIRHNLELMTSRKPGGLPDGMSHESQGGNAGYCGRMPCVGVHYIYDKNTGRIIQFDGEMGLPEELRETESGGILDITLESILPSARARVLRLGTQCTSTARENLEETMRRYNAQYGFEIPKDVHVPKWRKQF